MLRIDTHHHAIPPFYRDMLRKAGIDEAGGRGRPDRSPEASLGTMAELNVATAILSVSTPGTTFLPSPPDATSLARDINDYLADLVGAQPDRFGSSRPSPCRIGESVDEVVRSPTNYTQTGCDVATSGDYLGQTERTICSAHLMAFGGGLHPTSELPGPAVDGVAPFAADFLLDTPALRIWLPSMVYAASTRISASSSPTRVDSFPTRRTGWRSQSWATPDAVRWTVWMTSRASTSTSRCPPAPRHCRACSPSPNPDISPSAWPFALVVVGKLFTPAWKLHPDSTRTPARRSSVQCVSHSRARGSRRQMPAQRSIEKLGSVGPRALALGVSASSSCCGTPVSRVFGLLSGLDSRVLSNVVGCGCYVADEGEYRVPVRVSRCVVPEVPQAGNRWWHGGAVEGDHRRGDRGEGGRAGAIEDHGWHRARGGPGRAAVRSTNRWPSRPLVGCAAPEFRGGLGCPRCGRTRISWPPLAGRRCG